MGTPKPYDADAKAKAREAAGLKLNGATYTRRRRTNRVMRAVRRLSRRQAELQDELDGLTRARDVERLEDELDDETTAPARRTEIRDELREIRAARDETRIEELEDAFEETLYELLAHLLGPNENGQELSAAQLGEELDLADALALSKSLGAISEDDATTGPGAEPDPT